MKRFYLLTILAVCILMTGCSGCHRNAEKDSEETTKKETVTDTLGLGILKHGQESVADTLVLLAKEKHENRLLPDVEQVVKWEVSLKDIIKGATRWRRVVLLVAVLFIVMLFLQLAIAIRRKELGRTRLRLLAGITLVCGWALYYVGFFFGGTASSIPAFFVRPFLASIGMFLGDTGYQELSDDCTHSVVYMTLFAIVHFLAILISAIFVINFFWKRSMSSLRGVIWLRTQSSAPLNIFFGLGKQNILLAKSIQSKGQGARSKGHEARSKERILFVDLPTESEGQHAELSLSQLFGFNAFNQEAITELQGVKYAIKSALSKPSEIETSDGEVLLKLGLRRVRNLIKHHQQTRIFLLSDDEAVNVKSTLNLMHDATIRKNKVDIYCHARKNRENGIIEKKAYLEGDDGNLNVHLVDTSALSIHILKRHVEFQPVSFVEPDTTLAVVNNPFTALVLGFGETGRDAVRFLYEFGAFVNSAGRKSPFKCYAVDKGMNMLKGTFYHGAPAVRFNPEIELLQMDHQSQQFWSWFNLGVVQHLNYVVIALGDDHSNMQALADILETVCRVRYEALKNFKIFVRSYSSENEKQLDSLVDFYNNKCGMRIVESFGQSRKIFTYENIIIDETLTRAKEFFLVYAKESKMDELWDERHRINKDKATITLNDINAVIRKENQDIANSQHMDTKLKLLGLTRASAKALYWQADVSSLTPEQLKQKQLIDYILSFTKEPTKAYIKDPASPDCTDLDRIIMNIAICEHLRWNASHEMIGYTLGRETDEIKKEHACLKSWDLLPSDIQDYDYKVMETTIGLVVRESS